TANSLGTITAGTWSGGIITSAYGGTGNGFTKFSGPASSEKTFTLPNASATILTDNLAVTVAQGGTGSVSYTPYAVIVAGATNTDQLSTVSGVGTSGQVLTSNGASAWPTWQAASTTDSTKATKALDNLASVAINAALIPASAAGLDFGSTAKPWKDIWLAGSSGTPGTNQFKITGASTSGV